MRRSYLFFALLGLTLLEPQVHAQVDQQDSPEAENIHSVIDHGDLIQEVNQIDLSDCKVTIGIARLRGGPRCRRNEVMTGIIEGAIYCSTISVECFTER